MATPLQTFGRGPQFQDWEGNQVPTEQFGSRYGDIRRNKYAKRQDQRGGGDEEDDTFAAVPQTTAAPAASAAGAPPQADQGSGTFNPNIGGPSPSVQAALALPAGQRSLAQQKILKDRMGTEAMSRSRGGPTDNGISQAIADERTVARAEAQGILDDRVAKSYAKGLNSDTAAAAAAPGAATGAPSRVPGSTEAAQAPYTPKTVDPMASNSVMKGFAMRTMADGSVRTASGVGTGANKNVSNMQTFANEADAMNAFRPAPATPATAAAPGSMTPPDPRGMPGAGGGLPVAQMTMAGAGAATQGGDPFAPTMPRLGLPASMRPARPAGPAASVPSMTPPMDDPLNPANRQAQTLQSSNMKSPWGNATPRPQRQRSSNIIPQGIKDGLRDVFTYQPRPEEQAILDRRNGGTKAPAMGAPMQTPAAARTTAPTTQIKMTSKILGQPRNSGSQMMGAQLDPFRRS